MVRDKKRKEKKKNRQSDDAKNMQSGSLKKQNKVQTRIQHPCHSETVQSRGAA